MRLSKFLASSGVASRRGAESLIFEGQVQVNGEICKVPQTLVDPAHDEVCVQGKPVSQEKKVYFLLNKPAGYHCTNARPSKNTKLVTDIFAHLPYRLFTAGRLDRDTTGLIVVTNDGHFAQKLIHPSFNHGKEYVAKTMQEITFPHLEKLSAGTRVQGSWIKPLSVKKVRRGTVKITVAEGKKHEVRELLKAAGLSVVELTRIRIGPFILSTLPLGQYREINPLEVQEVNDSRT